MIITEENVKSVLFELGADLCGIAGTERFNDAPAGYHPCDLYGGCKSVIVFAKKLPLGLAYVNPRIIYINASDNNAHELDRIGLHASIELERLGCVCVPLPSDSPYEYWDAEKNEGKGLLSMRHAAVLAGLGSLGKNTLVINKKYGNMINIGAILCDLDLKSDPLSDELCKRNCRLCIDSCPPKALDDAVVNQKLCRAYTYGKNDRGFNICNCNKCRIVCPMSLGEFKNKGD